MEPVFRRSGFAPPSTPLTRRLLVYFHSGAYRRVQLRLLFREHEIHTVARSTVRLEHN